MDNLSDDSITLIKSSPVFDGLTESQINELLSHTKQVNLKQGDFLMQEGDDDKQFYLILNGELEVVKSDEELMPHRLAALSKGEIVGSIVMLDDQKRSASIRCLTDAELLIVSQANIEQLAAKDINYHRILKNIGVVICKKFRESNEIIIKAFKEKVAIYKIQVAMGRLLIGTTIVLSFLSFYNLIASRYMTEVKSSTYLTVPLMTILICFLAVLFKFIQLPRQFYGLTLTNAKAAVKGGIVYTIPFLVLTVLVKWLLIQYSSAYSGHSLFELYNGEHHGNVHAWLINQLIYALLICPIQELMSRSGLQAPLAYLLTGQNRIFWSIIASNIIFMTAHIFMSPFIALMVFFPGLYFGWLFQKYNSLIAPIIAHILLGVWGLGIVGLI